MQNPPAIADDALIACLGDFWGLRIARIDFLPLGGDLSTAVYRALADDGLSYFCKLKLGAFDTISVALPALLERRGIGQVIAPRRTLKRQLHAPLLGEHRLIVYPFVEGRDAFEVELTDDQWAQFGAALRQIHAVAPPRALHRALRKERFGPEWRQRCQGFVERLERDVFTEPLAATAAAFLRPRLPIVRELVQDAGRLAGVVAASAPEFVLCHTDLHPGNLLIDTRGAVHLVDWDYPMWAPAERDLMFIGGGQGFVGVTAQQEVERFASGYGARRIDAQALAYYRKERSVIDIAVECGRVLSVDVPDKDRAMSLQILHWCFDPGSSIEIALSTA